MVPALYEIGRYCCPADTDYRPYLGCACSDFHIRHGAGRTGTDALMAGEGLVGVACLRNTVVLVTENEENKVFVHMFGFVGIESGHYGVGIPKGTGVVQRSLKVVHVKTGRLVHPVSDPLG